MARAGYAAHDQGRSSSSFAEPSSASASWRQYITSPAHSPQRETSRESNASRSHNMQRTTSASSSVLEALRGAASQYFGGAEPAAAPVHARQTTAEGKPRHSRSPTRGGEGRAHPAIDAHGSAPLADEPATAGSLRVATSTARHSSATRAQQSTITQHYKQELEIVRKAWRQEGSNLRAKMVDIHKQRMQADERVQLLETELKTQEVKFREQAAKSKFEARRFELLANQMQEKLARETSVWKRKLEVKEDEVQTLRGTTHALDAKVAAMHARVTKLTAEVSGLRSELQKVTYQRDLNRQELDAVQQERTTEQRQHRISTAQLETEAEARLRQSDAERQSQAEKATSALAAAARLERQLAVKDREVATARMDARSREAALAGDLQSCIQRARTAEQERDEAVHIATLLRGRVSQLEQQIHQIMATVVALNEEV